MRRALALAGAALLVALSTPAHAENPVLDPEDDADVAAALAEATEVQGVCYGYELRVADQGTGRYSGQFASSSLGAGTKLDPGDARCGKGWAELTADLTYTSELSEAEDSASWNVSGTLPGVDTDAVEDLGLSSDDLLDDGRSALVLLNAVLALPRLASEQAGLPPVVLEPNTEPLPEGARATGTPGSDWLRENGALLVLCVLLLGGGLLAAYAARAQDRAARRPPRPPSSWRVDPPTADWSPR